MNQRRGRQPTKTDAEIIVASRVDPQLFGAIFDRHFDAIFRFLAYRLGSALAEDLASEAFCIAFDKRTSYDLDQEDARPWLYGIATNLVRRHRRAEQRQLRAYKRAALPADAPAFDEIAIIRQVDANALKETIAALAVLDCRDRDVLLLFAVANQSYQVIADTLGIPLGTVRSRLNNTVLVTLFRPSQHTAQSEIFELGTRIVRLATGQLAWTSGSTGGFDRGFQPATDVVNGVEFPHGPYVVGVFGDLSMRTVLLLASHVVVRTN